MTEPDYLMSLGAERTYLAYIRTNASVLIAGTAVVAGSLALAIVLLV